MTEGGRRIRLTRSPPFIPSSTGQFDRTRKIDRPLQILPGGYMSVFTSGTGWTQVTAQKSGELAAAGDDPKGKKRGDKDYGRLTRYGRERRTDVALNLVE